MALRGDRPNVIAEPLARLFGTMYGCCVNALPSTENPNEALVRVLRGREGSRRTLRPAGDEVHLHEDPDSGGLRRRTSDESDTTNAAANFAQASGAEGEVLERNENENTPFKNLAQKRAMSIDETGTPSPARKKPDNNVDKNNNPHHRGPPHLVHTDLAPRECGSGYARAWINSAAFESDLFWIRPEFKIHVLRLNGDYRTCVNRPGNPFTVQPSEKIHPQFWELDITKEGFSVLGGRQCRKPAAIQQMVYEERGVVYKMSRLILGGYVYLSEDKLDFVEYGRRVNGEMDEVKEEGLVGRGETGGGTMGGTGVR